MNQNERDDLAIYLGLQDFEVVLPLPDNYVLP